MAVDPKLLVIKPINEIQTASDPLSGQALIYDGGNELKKASLQGIKDSVSSGIVGEAITTTVPTLWTPGDPNLYEKYDVKTAGTFTNFTDSNNAQIVVTNDDLDGNFVQFWVHNGVTQKVIKELPSSSAENIWDGTDDVNAPTMKLLNDNKTVNEVVSEIPLTMNKTWSDGGSWQAYGQTFGASVDFIQVFAGKKIKIKIGTDAYITYVYGFDANKQNQTELYGGDFTGIKIFEYTPTADGYIKVNSNKPATYGAPTITAENDIEIFQRKNILSTIPTGSVSFFNTENAFYGDASGQSVNVNLPLGGTFEIVVNGNYTVNGISISNETAVLQNSGEFYILYRKNGRTFISQNGKALRYVRDYCGVDVGVTIHPCWKHIGVFNNGVNIALNKSVTANFTPQNYSTDTVGLSEITDGTVSTKYVAGSVADPDTEANYVIVDLGGIKSASIVDIFHFENKTFKFTKTQISQDGQTWETIFDSSVSGTYNEGTSPKSIIL